MFKQKHPVESMRGKVNYDHEQKQSLIASWSEYPALTMLHNEMIIP